MANTFEERRKKKMEDPAYRAAMEEIEAEERALAAKGEGITGGGSIGRIRESKTGGYMSITESWWSCRKRTWLNKKQFAAARRRDFIRRRSARRLIRNAARFAKFQKAKNVT